MTDTRSKATASDGPAHSLRSALRAVRETETSAGLGTLRIGISANISTDLLSTFIAKHFAGVGAKPEIYQGDYDSDIENMRRFAAAGAEIAIVLPFFDNLLPLFETQTSALPPDRITELRDTFSSRMRLALTEAAQIPRVYVAKFHLLSRPTMIGPQSHAGRVLEDFNRSLESVASEFANVRTIDTAAIIAAIGHDQSFDRRFYYRFKAPYSQKFCDEFGRQLFALTRGAGRRFYKVLVLDCDNTLWGGIVGEDLPSGLKLGGQDYPGNIYHYAQHRFRELQARHGVLLCLCTKNNPADVEEILRSHPGQVLRDEHLVTKRVNWTAKADNIQDIARELNLGLESFVFLDDSDFECAAVRERLPMVRVFQVPRNLSEYPAVIESIREVFLGDQTTEPAGDKTAEYRQRAAGVAERARHSSEAEYLASLQLQVSCRRNERERAARIAELSQKSNQFNLTTRRFTEAEILGRMDDPQSAVYSLHVRDKFGEAGLTGVVVVHYANRDLVIDAFLMSCRVIGRGIEFAFWPRIFADAQSRGCTRVLASFSRTAKNDQVSDFFDRLGLSCIEASDAERKYEGQLPLATLPTVSHVEVVNVG